MTAILNLLTPAQLDILSAAYDTAADWYDQAVLFLGDVANSIVIDDVVL